MSDKSHVVLLAMYSGLEHFVSGIWAGVGQLLATSLFSRVAVRKWAVRPVGRLLRPSQGLYGIVLPEDQERPIRDLLSRVESGGRALILLTGTAGSGKSRLANRLAGELHRPLLVVTGDDLFDGGDEVDHVIAGVFRRARDQNAVLLLEDAARLVVPVGTAPTLKAERELRTEARAAFLRELDRFHGLVVLTRRRTGGKVAQEIPQVVDLHLKLPDPKAQKASLRLAP